MSARRRPESPPLRPSWLLVPLTVLISPVLLAVLAAAPLFDLSPEPVC